jgi:hypothetical protein
MDHKPIGGVSVHHSRSQMATVKAMTFTVDSSLPRQKLDYDVGCNAAAKGASVVVKGIKIQDQCIREVRKHYHCLWIFVALSSSGDGGDAYHLGHRWICAIYLPVRRTGTKH